MSRYPLQGLRDITGITLVDSIMEGAMNILYHMIRLINHL